MRRGRAAGSPERLSPAGFAALGPAPRCWGGREAEARQSPRGAGGGGRLRDGARGEAVSSRSGPSAAPGHGPCPRASVSALPSPPPSPQQTRSGPQAWSCEEEPVALGRSLTFALTCPCIAKNSFSPPSRGEMSLTLAKMCVCFKERLGEKVRETPHTCWDLG